MIFPAISFLVHTSSHLSGHLVTVNRDTDIRVLAVPTAVEVRPLAPRLFGHENPSKLGLVHLGVGTGPEHLPEYRRFAAGYWSSFGHRVLLEKLSDG